MCVCKCVYVSVCVCVCVCVCTRGMYVCSMSELSFWASPHTEARHINIVVVKHNRGKLYLFIFPLDKHICTRIRTSWW